MGPEALIERTIRAEAKEAGWIVYKVQFPDTNGAPDRLFGKDRRGVFIEFKRGNKEPTRQQYKRHKELRELCGFEVYWVDNEQDARRILNLKGS